jgi:hypothetical protein
MNDDNSGLSQTEAAHWDAIIASEWPIESAILTTQLSSASVHPGGSDGTAEQRFVTVYQPRRPRLTPLAVSVLALATTAWLIIRLLIPAYQGAGQAAVSKAERAVEVHDLTIAAALVAISLVVAVSCIGMSPRCQPLDSGDCLRPTAQPRDGGNVDPAAPRRVHGGRLVDPAAA